MSNESRADGGRLELSFSELRGLELYTDRYFEIEAILRTMAAPLEEWTVPKTDLKYYVQTLSSKRSVARFQKARLFQYFMFCDESGHLDSLDVWNCDDLRNLFSERFRTARHYGFLLREDSLRRSEAEGDVTQGSVNSADGVVRVTNGFVTGDALDSLEPIDDKPQVEADLVRLVPGLTLGQMGNLCRAAAIYTRSEMLLDQMKRMNQVPLSLIACYLQLVHGPGYAAPSALGSALDIYLQAPSSVETEEAHHFLLMQLVAIVEELNRARAAHPMLYLTVLAKVTKWIKAAAAEVAESKHAWQVSKGHDRRKISSRIDAQLHLTYLRLRTGAPPNARVNWSEMAEIAGLDSGSASQATEQYARKLFSDRKELPWMELFMSPLCNDVTGFIELYFVDEQDYLTHADKIRRLRRAGKV